MTEKKINSDTKNADEGGFLDDPTRSAADETDSLLALTDPIHELESRLDAKEQEAKENYDRFLRVSAEFENYKKRARRETEDFKKYANEALVAALLPIVDNLQRAVALFKEKGWEKESIFEGVSLTLTEILKVLEKFHVKPIESLGQAFNPNFHEAIMQESSDDHPDNTVTQELQKGYLIHERLLRPSMVVVSRKKE